MNGLSWEDRKKVMQEFVEKYGGTFTEQLFDDGKRMVIEYRERKANIEGQQYRLRGER